MTDQLFLSIWLEPRVRARRVEYFEKLLRVFPFSLREQPQSLVSIEAVDTTEPPLLERPLNAPLDISEIVRIFRNYQGDDIAYRVESWWDLWQFDGDWKLTPARVELSCFGDDFDNGTGQRARDQDDLRIDFGLDAHYLPQIGAPEGVHLIESNIKSLLRLVHELDSSLPVLRRQLQTESGENFADRLQQTVASQQAVRARTA